MKWACPIHALEWQEFDRKNRLYKTLMSLAYSQALEEFEEAWDKEYESKNPKLIPPPHQPSIE